MAADMLYALSDTGQSAQGITLDGVEMLGILQELPSEHSEFEGTLVERCILYVLESSLTNPPYISQARRLGDKDYTVEKVESLPSVYKITLFRYVS